MTASISFGSARTASSASGCVSNATSALPMTRKVVSAGGEQQSEEPVEALVGQPFAVDLRVHELAQQVAGGFGPTLSTSGSRYSTIACDAAMPRSGSSGPVLISSAHFAKRS